MQIINKFFGEIHDSWKPIIGYVLTGKLRDFLDNINTEAYYPLQKEIFRVFKMDLKDIKVVMLGDYPTSITGLSVCKEARWDYLMREELIKDKKLSDFDKSEEYLSKYWDWNSFEHLEKQGVFLLNSALTTGKSGTAASSHIVIWKEFISRVVQFISTQNPCVWLIKGAYVNYFSYKMPNRINIDNYGSETINYIPLDSKINYVSTSTSFSGMLSKTNFILEGTKGNIIKW